MEKCVNETTVGVSAQDCVINEHNPVDTTQLRFEDFKPMVSIRDYIRRVVPTYSDTIPVANQVNGCTFVRLSQLIKGNGATQSALSVITRMFLGFTGGVKIKLVVKGDYGGKLYYVPPSTRGAVGVNGWFSTIPLNTLNSSNYQDPGPQFGSMFQEIPSVYPFSQNNARYVTTLFEFVVPNMNQYRYIGGPSFNTSSTNSAECDMGSVIYCSNNEPGADYDINFSVGFTDETRFGFQCVSPMTRLAQDGIGQRVSCYNPSTTTGFLTNPASFAPAAYYTKTT
jgi:hypothetical protein